MQRKNRHIGAIHSTLNVSVTSVVLAVFIVGEAQATSMLQQRWKCDRVSPPFSDCSERDTSVTAHQQISPVDYKSAAVGSAAGVRATSVTDLQQRDLTCQWRHTAQTQQSVTGATC